MNRKVIGMYLKQLREQKKLTQEQLASIFSEDYGISISVHAISEWENGNTLPTGENLEILAEIYDKTLDELLDGKDELNIDFNDVYFLSLNDSSGRPKQKYFWYVKRNQIVRIIKKTKEFIKKTIEKTISNQENKEFKFLFENFYNFSSYGKSIMKENQDLSFSTFLFLIRKVTNEMENKSFEEKYWEIQKIFKYDDNFARTLRYDNSDINNIDKPYVKKMFIESEPWEKDLMLSSFQEERPRLLTPDSYDSKHLQDYIDKNGNYDKDDFLKKCIRTLVENGACINKTFFNTTEVVEKKVEIINTLVGYYDMYFKPLLLRTLNDNGRYEYHKVENNDFNRFLLDVELFYSETIKELTKVGLSIEEIFDKVLVPTDISEDIYLLIASSHNIDTNRDKKLWMTDINFELSTIEREKRTFQYQLKRTIQNKKLYNELLVKFKNGEKYYIDRIEKKSSLMFDLRTMIERKNKLTFDQYLKTRDIDLTKKMLLDLDKLTFDELRKKYFMKED